VPYADWKPNTASYASRTMMMSGLIVAAFIIYHLLHFTVMVEAVNLQHVDFHSLNEPLNDYSLFYTPEHLPPVRHDIYTMMFIGFSHPAVSLFYIIAVGLLCLHLSHGLSAMFQSLGFKNHVYAPLIDKAAKLIALFLFLGYVSIPISVLISNFLQGGACCK
jgi:succinate dehydrogenase / fumarate reductase cytochrome b subunit